MKLYIPKFPPAVACFQRRGVLLVAIDLAFASALVSPKRVTQAPVRRNVLLSCAALAFALATLLAFALDATGCPVRSAHVLSLAVVTLQTAPVLVRPFQTERADIILHEAVALLKAQLLILLLCATLLGLA